MQRITHTFFHQHWGWQFLPSSFPTKCFQGKFSSCQNPSIISPVCMFTKMAAVYVYKKSVLLLVSLKSSTSCHQSDVIDFSRRFVYKVTTFCWVRQEYYSYGRPRSMYENKFLEKNSLVRSRFIFFQSLVIFLFAFVNFVTKAFTAKTCQNSGKFTVIALWSFKYISVSNKFEHFNA